MPRRIALCIPVGLAEHVSPSRPHFDRISSRCAPARIRISHRLRCSQRYCPAETSKCKHQHELAPKNTIALGRGIFLSGLNRHFFALIYASLLWYSWWSEGFIFATDEWREKCRRSSVTIPLREDRPRCNVSNDSLVQILTSFYQSGYCAHRQNNVY